MIRKRFIRRKHNVSQNGFTTIELVIVMALGVMVLAGFYKFVVGSGEAYKSNESISRMQENARFAANLLASYLRKAGYKDDWRDETSVQDSIDTCGQSCIIIRYQEIPPNYTCNGYEVTTTETVVARFELVDSNITCSNDVDGADAVTMIEGVESVEFFYGKLDSIDNVGFFTYEDAEEWAAQWDNVRSVRVVITVDSPRSQSRSSRDDARWHEFRTFENTVYLRNKIL